MKNIETKDIQINDYLFFNSDFGFWFALDKEWMNQNREPFTLKLPTDENLASSYMVAFSNENINIVDFQFFETETGFKGGVDASYLLQSVGVCELKLPNGDTYNDLIAEGYTCTDPDQHQYGKQLSEYKFHFLEFGPEGNEYFESEINMADYTVDDIVEKVSGYHPENEILDFINNKELFLLAEYIHESEI